MHGRQGPWALWCGPVLGPPRVAPAQSGDGVGRDRPNDAFATTVTSTTAATATRKTTTIRVQRLGGPGGSDCLSPGDSLKHERCLVPASGRGRIVIIPRRRGAPPAASPRERIRSVARYRTKACPGSIATPRTRRPGASRQFGATERTQVIDRLPLAVLRRQRAPRRDQRSGRSPDGRRAGNPGTSSRAHHGGPAFAISDQLVGSGGRQRTIRHEPLMVVAPASYGTSTVSPAWRSTVSPLSVSR